MRKHAVINVSGNNIEISNLTFINANNTPELREKHYGQFDHLRLYGADFKQRIFESGFELSGEDFIKNLGLETIERYALVRNEKIYECRK